MQIERSITIAREIDDVFAFVCDSRNDPIWCPKVKSVEHRGGPDSGPGAEFLVVHRPVPLLPVRQMKHTLVAWERPREIVWAEDDGQDRITVTYSLEPAGRRTRIRQHDFAELGAPKVFHPFMRLGIGTDIAGQLRRLRRHLETNEPT